MKVNALGRVKILTSDAEYEKYFGFSGIVAHGSSVKGCKCKESLGNTFQIHREQKLDGDGVEVCEIGVGRRHLDFMSTTCPYDGVSYEHRSS